MESTELQEGLFKAIQTIAKSEVNKMSFDMKKAQYPLGTAPLQS